MRKKIILLMMVFILFIIYIFFAKDHHLIFCPIHELMGLYCPGCGITRMFVALLEGDIYQAFRFNPGVFILLPFFLIYAVEKLISYMKNKDSYFDTKIPKIVWYILLVLMVIYMILRNLPWFDFLAPTIV